MKNSLTGGSKETIVDGITGFCTQGFDVEEIGDLVLTALFDENLPNGSIVQDLKQYLIQKNFRTHSLFIRKNETRTTYCRQSWLGI